MSAFFIWTLIASASSVVAMAPQALRSARTRNAAGVSAATLALVTVAACWRLAYALLEGAWVAALGTVATGGVAAAAWVVAGRAGCRDRRVETVAAAGILVAVGALFVPSTVSGFVGAVFTALMAVPQAVTATKTRRSADAAEGVSVAAFGLASFSSFAWIGYWALLHSSFGVVQSLIHGVAAGWVAVVVGVTRQRTPLLVVSSADQPVVELAS